MAADGTAAELHSPNVIYGAIQILAAVYYKIIQLKPLQTVAMATEILQRFPATSSCRFISAELKEKFSGSTSRPAALQKHVIPSNLVQMSQKTIKQDKLTQ